MTREEGHNFTYIVWVYDIVIVYVYYIYTYLDSQICINFMIYICIYVYILIYIKLLIKIFFLVQPLRTAFTRLGHLVHLGGRGWSHQALLLKICFYLWTFEYVSKNQIMKATIVAFQTLHHPMLWGNPFHTHSCCWFPRGWLAQQKPVSVELL